MNNQLNVYLYYIPVPISLPAHENSAAHSHAYNNLFRLPSFLGMQCNFIYGKEQPLNQFNV